MRVIIPTVLIALAACGGKQEPVTAPAPNTAAGLPAAPSNGAAAANRTPPSTTTAPSPAPAVATPSGAPMGPVTYRCDGGSLIEANYSSNRVTVRWNGRAYPLAVDPATADGLLYKGSGYQWRVNGKHANLIERGRPVATDCEPS